MGYSVIGSARDFDSRRTGSNPVTPVLLCGVKGKIIGRGKIVLKLKVWGMDLIPRQVTEIYFFSSMERMSNFLIEVRKSISSFFQI